MTIRSVTETKAQLSSLLVLVEEGEDVVVTRGGKAVAKLVRIGQSAQDRKPGALEGKIKLAPDFDARLPEFEAMFYGEA